MKRLALGAAVLLVVGVVAASAFGAAGDQLTVCASGCQYTTIAAAVDAATDGDKIAIRAGRYAGDVTVDEDVTIVGAGAGVTVIDFPPSPIFPRIGFFIAPGSTVAIRGLTIDATASIDSGGISSWGTLALKRVVVENANSVFLAGILNNGTMSLKDSVVRNNVSEIYGGIGNNGQLTIQDSSVTSNQSYFDGGGIDNNGTLVVKHSTISDNDAGLGSGSWVGGGILNNGEISLLKVTFSNNTPSDCHGC